MKSIMTKNMEVCFLCGSRKCTEIHHIYSGPFRKKSTKYGMVVPLCYECHRGTNGVHSNRAKMDKLRALGQRKFQEVYPNIDFLKTFGRNYFYEETELPSLDLEKL